MGAVGAALRASGAPTTGVPGEAALAGVAGVTILKVLALGTRVGAARLGPRCRWAPGRRADEPESRKESEVRWRRGANMRAE